jgi:hypothetical protein
MTIGRIGGPMLKENLIRQGVDLSFETNLLYLDVNNMRIGVSTATPNVALDINGTTRFSSNLQIDGSNITTYANNTNITLSPHGTGKVAVPYLTNTRILLAGPNGTVVDSPNLTFDGTTLSVGSLGLGNLSVSGNTLTTINTDGDIVLDPNGTGSVVIDTNDVVANRVLYSSVTKEVITNANLTFDGSNLDLLGVANITTLNVGTISSNATNGNINLDPNGTGNVLLDTAGANSIVFTGTNKELLTDSDLQFNGTTLQIGNITLANNTISSASGNINITPTGTNRVVFESTNSMRLPIGDTSQRPTPVEGDFRYNNETKLLEYYTGVDWNTLTVDIIYNISEAFNGDGSTNVFALSQPTSSDGAFVALNGVLQSPGLAYGISGYTLTFTEAPAIGDRIDIRYITLANELSLTSISDVNTTITVDDTAEIANVNINGTAQVQITTSTTKINNSFATTAPVTKTADFSLTAGENFVIVNKVGSTCTVTLPTASANIGRQVTIKTLQAQTVVSASSNVAPIDSATPGTGILTNVVGKWATLVSDGTNWVIMAAN